MVVCPGGADTTVAPFTVTETQHILTPCYNYSRHLTQKTCDRNIETNKKSRLYFSKILYKTLKRELPLPQPRTRNEILDYFYFLWSKLWISTLYEGSTVDQNLDKCNDNRQGKHEYRQVFKTVHFSLYSGC